MSAKLDVMAEYCIGIDIGATSIKMGLFETSGKLLNKWEIDTNKEDNGRYILSEIVSSLNHQLGLQDELKIEHSNIKGIGIGIPGPVTGDGNVSASVNLGWVNVSVKDQLKQLIDIPVKVGNDANVATLGEMWQGSGKGYKNLVMITLGTGVGGGVVIDEKIVSGFYGAAGEFGHMPIIYDEVVRCNCGKCGCLEQAASATGIINEAKKRIERKDIKSILDKVENLTAYDIFEAAKAGDELANQVIDRAAKYLGIAMASITGVIDPEVFIIGGGVSGAGQILLDLVKKHYMENVLFLSKDTQIKLAALKNDAGIYGAARMVLE